MASNNEEQRRKDDLELLALFDPECPQDLSGYSPQDVFSCSPQAPQVLPSVQENSNECPGLGVSAGQDATSNWTANLDEETLAILDEIIAASLEDSKDSRTFRSPRKFKCPMCPREFNSNAAMRRHGRRHILKLIKCHCGFKGQSPVQQQKHHSYHHSGVLKHHFLASF